MGILSLDKKYGKLDIDNACERALQLKSYSYRTVKAFLLNPNPLKAQYMPENKDHDFKRKLEEYLELLN